MPKFINYDEPTSILLVEDGDKLWRITRTFVQVFHDDVGNWKGFYEDRLWVASINVDKKFKIYYGDFGDSPERVAAHGRKLAYSLKPLAERLFPDLVNNGWEFITEHGT